MSKTVNDLAKHSLIYGLGDLLTKLLGFILIPVYTHYLSPAQYGILELLQLSSYVFSLLVAMGISQAVIRFYYEFEHDEQRLQVVSVALITIWVAAIIGLVVSGLFAEQISNLVFQDSSYYSLFYILFATVAVSVTAEIPQDYLRIKEQSLLYAGISLVRVALTLLLNIFCLVYLEMGVAGVLVSGLIAQSVSGFYLLFYLLRKVPLSFSWPLLWRMLRYSVPLIASWASGFVMHFCDRFLLQRLASLSEVGVYALGYKFGFLLNALLLTPFQRSWGPKRFEIADSPEAAKTFPLVLTYYFSLQVFMTLGICAVIEQVLALAAGPEFQLAHLYVAPLLVAYNFYGVFAFFEFGLLQQKKTGIHAGINFAACILNLALNFTLIPLWGAWGAVWATMATFIVLASLTFWRAQKLYYIEVEWLRIAKVLGAALALYGATLSIDLANPWLAILVKGSLAATLPVLLILLGFYRESEKQKAAELLSKGLSWLKSSWG